MNNEDSQCIAKRRGHPMIRYRHVMLLVSIAILGFVAMPSGTIVPAAAAAEPVASPGSPYQMTGTIDAVDLANNTLLIDDRGYQLTDNVTIHAGNNHVATKFALRKGARVGFNIVNIGGIDQRSLNEIWIISGR
jgi:hypothetical protein